MQSRCLTAAPRIAGSTIAFPKTEIQICFLKYIYIYICVCVCVCIYIYIFAFIGLQAFYNIPYLHVHSSSGAANAVLLFYCSTSYITYYFYAAAVVLYNNRGLQLFHCLKYFMSPLSISAQ
jgi:hypothetical protein